MKREILTLIALAAVLSCSKQAASVPDQGPDTFDDSVKGYPILFNISDDIELKSSVSGASDLSASDAKVYVWVTKDGSKLERTGTADTSYCNKQLFYTETTGLWDIQGTKLPWECKDSTHASCLYNFSVFAYKGDRPSAVQDSTTAGFGKTFTIEMPKDYSDGCGTDFLLSNITSVVTTWNGSAARGALVNIHMEHALASVGVKVNANKNIHRIGIQGIEIKNFYRGGTMRCTSQEAYGSGKKNKWSLSNPTLNTGDYKVGDVTKGSGNTYDTIDKCSGAVGIITKDSARERQIMDFIAIPQDPSYTVLTIAYLVQEVEGATEHQVVNSWNLSNYDKWEYGCRNLYTITIDTSNSLYSAIDDWNEGNSVTGVVLP